jgi:Circularly permutated YpsA SLOG family
MCSPELRHSWAGRHLHDARIQRPRIPFQSLPPVLYSENFGSFGVTLNLHPGTSTWLNRTFQGRREIRIEIRTGGQSGVDRAALDVALAKGIPYSGWCPNGGWAEDFPIPPGVLVRYPHLVETPSALPRQRTAWNVRDSNATLIILRGKTDASPGTEFSQFCADVLFLKPFYVADLSSTAASEKTRTWLATAMCSASAPPFIVNIAGPRESEAPGIYAATFTFLSHLVDAFAATNGVPKTP